ncbi:MAG: 4'-phosphopantetheinyl transferase superfamily protein [Ruminococcaceae bacterium]|nr:4'-phosphopantetheinyl transferase superfamily protein [Oscillospiraceae bacterium]
MNIVKVYIIDVDDYTGSEELVFSMANKYCNEFSLESPDKIIRNSRGKPFFSERDDLFFSLSHSGDYVGVAFSRNKVGFDIQVHRKHNYIRIAKRFFSPSEYSFVKQKGELAFFDIWSAKESYVKYIGQGLSFGLDSFSVISDGRFKKNVDGVFLTRLDFLKNYSVFLSSESERAVLHEITL